MEITFAESPVTLACHPDKNLVAVGCVDGSIFTRDYNNDQNQKGFNLHNVSHEIWSRKHKAPVRKLRFSSRGESLYALTRNRTLTQWDAETGRKTRVIRGVTHEKARPYSMQILGEHRLAVGDEKGKIQIFDWRSDDHPCIATLDDDQTEEYITDLATDTSDRYLFATCGDFTLMTADLRKRKIIMKSETMHSELLSVTTAKNETKLLCGAADGYMEAFNWDEWANIVERIDSKHKDTVDCLLTVDENFVVSGSADGSLRLHHVFPNRMLKIIGTHDQNAPVEELALTFDRKFVISCGQDSKMKFWDLKTLKKSVPKCSQSGAKLKKQISKKQKMPDFFNDLCKNCDY